MALHQKHTKFYSDLLAALELEIAKTERGSQGIALYAQAIGIVSERIRELHGYAVKLPAGREAEVFFFREVWPKFYGWLFYYHQLHRFDMTRLSSPGANLRELIRQEERRVSRFFRVNGELWLFFRSGAVVLNHKINTFGLFDVSL